MYMYIQYIIGHKYMYMYIYMYLLTSFCILFTCNYGWIVTRVI